MPIKQYKPTTAGRRKSSVQSFKDVTAKRPAKSLVVSNKQQAGRGASGHITVRHRGGGNRRHIRVIDWARNKFDIPAKVQTIEYDPNRGARIALVAYADGEKRYMLAPQGVTVGMTLVSSRERGEPAVGNRFPLEKIPVGMQVHSIELQPGRGGQMVHGAGLAAELLAIEGDNATLRLPSGEMRMVSKVCMATIGTVSNPDWHLVRWGKAGRIRHKGIRPTVRGKAMNPVDHPHGGGEARNSIGLKAPKTPTGKKALGVKTRKSKKPSNSMILRRRQHGKRNA
ncbi:MAG: 50S ribosomal protein L2 [Candidatus Uhrbacteria bacterium GW2011_GWD2_52_7]|uniref:Large ribosomal subunit protein uL2 n=1 Tax=Candidatus Uhrbacteria bacterium GW2011_GWD2_52_7 TaxID=1618989 RepID=A0A0G1XH48_9BACT|nr:MAG: 50S ribosomal protein L2 [Candidatus Uhrbacteria bacterium GW2011_GWD2_52_7]